jgi:hypothetical protein
LAVDHIGQSPLECAQRFHRCFASSDAAAEVGAALGVVAQLNDSHDVQRPVDASVTGAGQAVAFLVAGGGVQGCGAVPGGEPGSGGEAGYVGDVTENAGGAGGADAVQVEQAGSGRGDRLPHCLVAVVHLLVQHDDLAEQFGGELEADPAGGGARRVW